MNNYKKKKEKRNREKRGREREKEKETNEYIKLNKMTSELFSIERAFRNSLRTDISYIGTMIT